MVCIFFSATSLGNSGNGSYPGLALKHLSLSGIFTQSTEACAPTQVPAKGMRQISLHIHGPPGRSLEKKKHLLHNNED